MHPREFTGERGHDGNGTVAAKSYSSLRSLAYRVGSAVSPASRANLAMLGDENEVAAWKVSAAGRCVTYSEYWGERGCVSSSVSGVQWLSSPEYTFLHCESAE